MKLPVIFQNGAQDYHIYLFHPLQKLYDQFEKEKSFSVPAHTKALFLKTILSGLYF